MNECKALSVVTINPFTTNMTEILFVVFANISNKAKDAETP